MISEIDKQQVERQFSRAASTYDHAAFIQREMSELLLELYTEENSRRQAPESILDLGCGTGHTLHKLKKIYPSARQVGVDISEAMLDEARKKLPGSDFCCMDMEDVDRNEFFDLIISNASIQWCNLEAVLKEVSRLLSPGGTFVYSSFGPKTHSEISLAWKLTEPGSTHSIELLELDTHLNTLSEKGFELLKTKTKTYRPEFSSAEQLLKSIKRTGATNASNAREKGLLSRNTYQQFLRSLEAQNPLQLSYEALMFIARKPL